MCETYFELSRERLAHNWAYIRSKTGEKVRILVNLKANAYGHGAVEIGRFLENKADYFSVACQGEGEQLRKAGIRTPILVYNPPVEWNESFFANGLEPALYDTEQAGRLIAFLRTKNIRGVSVHVKLDTGMHRSGLMPDKIPAMINILQSAEEVKLVGIFSHLAAADDPTEDRFTRLQIERFDRWSREFFAVRPDIIRHIANSSALFRFPEAYFDMVRPGLSVYGISPVEGEPVKYLKPIGRLTNRITQIRQVAPGETVGYNRLHKVEKDSVIALVPTGYADGYKRALGLGKAYAVVKGNKAPVIGKINMDMITLDITGIDARVGDRVIFFGDDPRADELAVRAGTIPYEITTSVSHRVKRVWRDF
jgi:alanine racemase